MADDWRVKAALHEQGRLRGVLDVLRGHEVEREVRKRLGDRVAVSAGDDTIFLYADTREAALEAEQVARAALAEHGVEADFALQRWHPLAEEWKPGDDAFPETEAARAAEHAALEEREAQKSQASGQSRWEVRVTLGSHADAVELADRLEQEGLAVARRWRFLLVGADDEDEARALEERIRAELPEDAETEVEPTTAAVAEVMPQNPFTIFGGLGG